jgi:hypothetical protein
MRVYLGKYACTATKEMTTHTTVRNLSRRVEGVGHKLSIALMMEAARTSEMLVIFYQTIRRYNPEDSHFCLWIISSLLLLYLMIWLLEKLTVVELYDQTIKTWHLTLEVKQ